MKVAVDYGRAKEVFGRLLVAEKEKFYPFNRPDVMAPHDPRNLPLIEYLDDLEKARFLKLLCFGMRGGINSSTATRAFSKLMVPQPELFDPYKAQGMNPIDIEVTLAENGLGRAKKDNARFWVGNSRLLVQRWDGSPINIFHDFAGMAEEEAWIVACQRIRNQGELGTKGGFAGFQKKMVSMLIYFMMDCELIPKFHFPLPIDFHVLRTCFITGVIRVTDNNGSNIYNEKTLHEARRLTFEYAVTENVSSLRLCDALWLFSRSMCSNSPGFKSKIIESNARNSVTEPQPAEWGKSQVEAYSRTCDACSLGTVCTSVIRSASYYLNGRIDIEKKRKSPHLNLFSPEVVNGFYAPRRGESWE